MNRIQIRISKRQTAISSLMIAILLTVVLSVTVVAAQSVTGSVSGTVKDAAGAAVSGAEVSLVHAQAVLRTTITGADGKFTFDNVAPGTYAINVAHSGFGQYSSVVQVTPGEKRELSLELEVNPLSEEVTVTAEAGQVSDARKLAQPVNVISYGLVGLRGAVRFGERSEVLFDFENIGDKQYRGISWGVDGAGRGVTLRYRYKF